MPDPADTLTANAMQPKRVQADGVSVEQHSISDQIKALEYARDQAAGSRRTLPIRIAKLVPGGPTGC